MASFLDKANVPNAVTHNTHCDFSHTHITTSNPFSLQPIMTRELIPGQSIDVSLETLTRMNVLPVPTFGRMNLKIRSFFVPYSTIFRGWHDFLGDTNHVASDATTSSMASVGLIQKVPVVKNSTLIEAFRQSVGSSVDDIEHLCCGGTSTDYDIRLYVHNATPNPGYIYLKYTVSGMTALKNLESWGYKINWNTADETEFSALPLLAACRIYADWYFPSQYCNSYAYDNLMSMCNSDASGSAGIELDYTQVSFILGMTSWSNYENDIWTSCWDVPNQPSIGNTSDFKLVNVDTVSQYSWKPTTTAYGGTNGIEAGYVTNNSGSISVNGPNIAVDAPFINPVINAIDSANTSRNFPTPISQQLLHSLHALTDWMQRNRISGGKAYERLLARYGHAIPSAKLNRSQYLGGDSVPLQIGDVMSTSDTSGAALGDYAGKGLGYGTTHFEYKADDFGLFVVMASVVPVTGYFQGINPEVKRLYKMDYFQPEMQSVGVEPVTSDLLYISDGATGSGTGLIDPQIHNHVFGWLPRYYSYLAQMQDKVTGNFRVPTLNGALGSGTPVEFNAANSWYLMRTFNDATWNNSSGNPDYNMIVHSPDFMSGKVDGRQYTRIFSNVSATSPDQLTMIFQFHVGSNIPAKALFDNYEFEEEGKRMTLDVNGVKLN